MQNIWYDFRHLPPSLYILPFVDQVNIYNAFNFRVSGTDSSPANAGPAGLTNVQVASRPLPVFTCPSMPEPQNPEFACWSSYTWCRGSYALHFPQVSTELYSTAPATPNTTYSWTHSDGVFVTAFEGGNTERELRAIATANGTVPNTTSPNSPIWRPYSKNKQSLRDITDGLSNTIAVGEGHLIQKGYLTSNQANNSFINSIPAPVLTPGDGPTAWGANGGDYFCEGTMNVPMNTLTVDNVTSRYYFRGTTTKAFLEASMLSPLFSFRSTHAGGVQFLFCDGSVNFLNQNINMAVYKALGSRAGGETNTAY
jgi:prepilin-type processing-associated H-X9-DG protein